MFICYQGVKRIEINFTIEEARAILKQDVEKLEEFAGLIQKFVTWDDDSKMIYTKRLFDDEQRKEA